MSRRVLALASECLADRRQFVLSGASLAVLPWLSNVAHASRRHNTKFAADPFQLGVASGDPSSDGMVLWTRLAPAPLEGGGMPPEVFEVAWEVAKDDSMRQIVKKGIALATPQLGHAVHVELKGLEPDGWYWYRFSIGDAQSPIGRTRTMPAREVLPERLRFAFASCQHYEAGLFTAYEHMSAEELDLVVHLGDYIYEMAGQDKRVRKHAGLEITSLGQYRDRYAQYRLDPHLQRAHAQFPWLVVWDDHEFDNNCAGCISEEKDISPEDFLLRRANAYQAYYEHMPLRPRCLPRGPDMRLYRRVAFGRLAEFEMLDTRQYRTDQPNGDGKRALIEGALDPRGTLLGEKQERWLMAGLLSSAANWNILAQQVMMARVNLASADSPAFSMDQWPGYDVARKRLLGFLAERRVPNPVVLTGDIHTNWVNDLKVDCDREEDAVVATEFVGTSISSGGNGAQEPKGLASILSENPFVRFHNGERGYVSCTLTPSEWRSDFRVVEYVDRPGATLITRKSYVVESGRAGAVEA